MHGLFPDVGVAVETVHEDHRNLRGIVDEGNVQPRIVEGVVRAEQALEGEFPEEFRVHAPVNGGPVIRRECPLRPPHHGRAVRPCVVEGNGDRLRAREFRRHGRRQIPAIEREELVRRCLPPVIFLLHDDRETEAFRGKLPAVLA